MTEKVFLVFDLETAPIPYESFSESQREYIVRGAKTEEETQKKMSEMALSPLTAQIITIGMKIVKPLHPVNNDDTKVFHNYSLIINADLPLYKSIKDEDISAANAHEEPEFDEIVKKDYRISALEESYEKYYPYGDDCKSVALMTNPKMNETEEPIKEKQGEITYVQTTERNIIEMFWKTIERYKGCVLITFNGRNFDAPFLMLRSAILGIKPTRNLMDGTKFSYSNHIDLLDELTFYSPSAYGASKRYNFDFYTRSFGLVSPKSEGIDGSLVSEFYQNEDYFTIARYCLRDVDATWKLYLRIKDYLSIKK